MTSALNFYKTSIFIFFLLFTYQIHVFTNKINFGNLGNFVTVGDTYFKVI
jgi:hypothetical protein